MCQIYEDNDKSVHGQSYTKNLDFKINKQRPEGQAVISGYCGNATVMRKKIVMKFQII